LYGVCQDVFDAGNLSCDFRRVKNFNGKGLPKQAFPGILYLWNDSTTYFPQINRSSSLANVSASKGLLIEPLKP
jgi:hypothetical protein